MVTGGLSTISVGFTERPFVDGVGVNIRAGSMSAARAARRLGIHPDRNRRDFVRAECGNVVLVVLMPTFLSMNHGGMTPIVAAKPRPLLDAPRPGPDLFR